MSPYHATTKGPRGAVTETYVYRVGSREFFKARYENKTFSWHHWRDGIQTAGTDGIEMPLYRAEDLDKADPSTTLWICEGEKDADRLSTLGLLATSSPHGALSKGKNWPAAHTRAVCRFNRVYVLEDNDEVGREHARKVANALNELVPEVRVVRLPGLPEHGDVADWLDSGGTREGLERFASAVVLEPPRCGLIVTPFSEIEEKPIKWQWRGRIPKGMLTLIEGPPKAGKSTMLDDLAARVSTGSPMPDGQPCEVQGHVIILSGEDAKAEVIKPRLRVAGACLEKVSIVEALDREGRPRHFVIGPEDIADLEQEIRKRHAVLLIIDPLSIYMGSDVDAHREQDVRQSLWNLADLAERTGCTIVCCRHWNKARTGDALIQGVGSVGFSAAARSILSVARAPDGSRVLAVASTNYATDYPPLAFHLETAPGETDVARVVWDGISPHDADSLAGVQPTQGERTKLQEARDFLDEYVGDREVPSEELEKAAQAEGVAWSTIKRAKGPKKGPLYVSKKHASGAYWIIRRARPEDQEDQGNQTPTDGLLPMGDRDSDGLLREYGRLSGRGDAVEPEGGQV